MNKLDQQPNIHQTKSQVPYRNEGLERSLHVASSSIGLMGRPNSMRGEESVWDMEVTATVYVDVEVDVMVRNHLSSEAAG